VENNRKTNKQIQGEESHRELTLYFPQCIQSPVIVSLMRGQSYEQEHLINTVSDLVYSPDILKDYNSLPSPYKPLIPSCLSVSI